METTLKILMLQKKSFSVKKWDIMRISRMKLSKILSEILLKMDGNWSKYERTKQNTILLLQ